MALKGLGSMIVGFQMWGSLGGLGMSPYVLQRMYKSRYFDFEREPGREWQNVEQLAGAASRVLI